VGHEIDWTIVDYTSDLRLPTPTAVAEFLAPLKSILNEKLDFIFKRILRTVYKLYLNRELKIDDILKKIRFAIGRNFNSKNTRFNILKLTLKNFDRSKILKMGYAIVRKNGKILNCGSELVAEDELEIEVYRKKFKIIVKELLSE
jgi:exodeoxyribonuclease VII large subunit